MSVSKMIRYLATLAVVLLAAWGSYNYLGPEPALVQKSPSDPKSYRAVTLENGLRVMLISDPKADQAAASIGIGVGQFQDPANRQGLAHYLEHMLFLGTQAFPEPDGFGKYLSEHGGRTNAFTSLEDTNFYFEVNQDHLPGALKRFSQFFVTPLFSPEFAGREINAVDSEHQKNLQNDFRRLFQVQKEGFNPKHPMSRFGTGSLESLGGENLNQDQLQQDLRRFFKTHYTAQRMTLAVLGNQSLDQLEELVAPLFSEIPDFDPPARKYLDTPPITDPLPRLVKVQPVQQQRWLKLSWVLPSQKKNFRSRPAELISHLLGHEGPGSLLSYYKSKGWASKLTASPAFSTDDFSLFELHVELTPEGLKHWGEITEAAFAFINKLKAAPDLQTYQAEQDRIGELSFRFIDEQEPGRYVQQIASNLQDVPAEEVLAQPYRYAPLEPGEAQALLKRLTPHNLSVYLMAEGFEYDRKEPYYGTAYANELVPDDLLESWERPRTFDALALAPPNPFIPEQVELVERDQTSDAPQLLADQPGYRLWFRQDPGFGSPKLRLEAALSSPLAYDSPENAALTRIYANLVDERMNEYAYAARLAGLKFKVDSGVQGLELHLEGYPETVGKLFTRLLAEMSRPEVQSERFERLKRELKEERENQAQRQAFHRAIYEAQYLTNRPLWHHRDYLAVIDRLRPEQLEAFIPRLLGRMHLETLLLGNLDQATATELGHALQAGLGARPLEVEALPTEQAARLEAGEPLAYAFESKDVNAAIDLVFQAGPKSLRQTAELALIAQIVEKRYYHQLRTIEQLGYIVWSMRWRQHGVEGLAFLVQSNVAQPPHLRKRILSFLKNFAEELKTLPEETFESHRQALVQQLTEDPKNLGEAAQEHWARISSRDYDFQEDEKVAQELSKLTPQDLAQRLQAMVFSAERRALSVEAFARGNRPQASGWPLIKDPSERKLNQAYFPNPPAQPKR